METENIHELKIKLNQLVKEHNQKEKEISELLNAAKTVLKSDDFEITARKIFDSCKETIGAKAGYVALLSDDGHENELLFLEDGGMPCFVNPNLPMPIRGLREESYKTGKVVFDNDFMKSEWVKFMPKGHMSLPNVLFSPLNIENKTVGIMGLACKDGDFTENDARIAAAFGDYAAIALQNSRTLEKLKISNSAKDKFFSIIAHDLKTPFNSLIGFSELLIDSIEKEDFQDFQHIALSMNSTLNLTYTLLSNLLEWSRSQTNRISFSPEEFDFHQLTNEVLDVFKNVADNKGIKVKNNMSSGLIINADKNMLNTVVRNIISNAIKYTRKDGNIIISAEFKQNNFMCSVADEGIGIDKELKSKIFTIDNKTSRLGTHNEKGTGLGLNICNEFIKKHNGLIGVDSKVGEGSTFWFKIPNQENKK